MGSCQPWFDRGARVERRRRARRAGSRAMETGPPGGAGWSILRSTALRREGRRCRGVGMRGCRRDGARASGEAGKAVVWAGGGSGARGHRGAETPEHGWRYRGAGMRASVFLSPSRLFGLFCARREWARMEGEPTGRRGGAARGEKGRFRPIDPIGWPYGRLRSRRTRRRGRSCRLRRRTKVRGRRRRRNCPWRTNP